MTEGSIGSKANNSHTLDNVSLFSGTSEAHMARERHEIRKGLMPDNEPGVALQDSRITRAFWESLRRIEREQSTNPDDFQNATLAKISADVKFCSL